MNYYERHLGDYAKDTTLLSMLEHGAYNLLLDRYYVTECGIPEEDVYAVAKATNKVERAAADKVLRKFFSLKDGVWIKNRVEEEIARYQEQEPQREQNRKNNKDRQARARERRREMFEQLRGMGITPPFDASMTHLNALLLHANNALNNAHVTRYGTATSPQTPLIPSEANASGGEPPGTRKPLGDEPSAKDIVFAVGVPLLLSAGLAERNARSFLAHLCKGGKEVAVAAAIQLCASERPVEPVSWLQSRLQPNLRPNGKHSGFAAKDYRAGVTEDGTFS